MLTLASVSLLTRVLTYSRKHSAHPVWFHVAGVSLFVILLPALAPTHMPGERSIDAGCNWG